MSLIGLLIVLPVFLLLHITARRIEYKTVGSNVELDGALGVFGIKNDEWRKFTECVTYQFIVPTGVVTLFIAGDVETNSFQDVLRELGISTLPLLDTDNRVTILCGIMTTGTASLA